MRTTIGTTILTAAILAFTGCSSSSDSGGNKANPQSGTNAPTTPLKAGHKKEHKPGPHDGTIFDWGGWHLEFVVDHAKQEARIYIYGSDEKTPAPIKADKLVVSIKKPLFQLEMKPEKQPGDPEGAYSCFVGKAKELGVKQDFEGTVTGTIEGKQYNADFAEGDDHDHPPKK